MDLVTGGTGIVGAHLLLELRRRGRAVRAIRREAGPVEHVRKVFRHYGEEALFEGIDWVATDLLDAHGLAGAMTGVEQVYHCAACVSFDPRDRAKLIAANITGTAQVVNAALEAGVRRLVHVSSTAAIGRRPGSTALTEADPWHAGEKLSLYAVSKREAELEVARGIAEGLDAVIANPSVVIGPGAPGRSTMSLMERLQRGTAFYPPGMASTVDARDASAGLITLMEQGATGERYLLVGEQVPYRDLFTQVLKAFGHAAPRRAIRPWMLALAWRAEALRGLLTGSPRLVTRATARSAQSRRTYDASKAHALGISFRPLHESVRNTVAFMRS